MKLAVEKMELNFKEIWAYTWVIYKKSIHILFLLGILLAIPRMQYDLSMENLTLRLIANIGLWIESMAIISFTGDFICGEGIKFGTAIKKSFSNILGGIRINVLKYMVILPMTCLLIIPGLLWSMYYMFSSQALILKNIQGKKALEYSKSLVKGNIKKVIRFILSVLGIAMIIAIVGIFINFYFKGSFLSILFWVGLNFICFPIVIIFTTVFFINLQIQSKEPIMIDSIEKNCSKGNKIIKILMRGLVGVGVLIIAFIVWAVVSPDGGVKTYNNMDEYALESIKTNHILKKNENLIMYYDNTLAMDGTEAFILTDERVIHHKGKNNSYIKIKDIHDMTCEKNHLDQEIIDIKDDKGKWMRIEIDDVEDGKLFYEEIKEWWHKK